MSEPINDICKEVRRLSAAATPAPIRVTNMVGLVTAYYVDKAQETVEEAEANRKLFEILRNNAIRLVEAFEDECEASKTYRNNWKALESENGELKAQRYAYATEFPHGKDGEPDTGSIHENIRKLKAKNSELAQTVEALQKAHQTVVREYDATSGALNNVMEGRGDYFKTSPVGQRLEKMERALHSIESWFRKWESDAKLLARNAPGGWPDGDGSAARENYLANVLPGDIEKARAIFRALGKEVSDKANTLLPELKKQWLAELLKDAPVVYSAKTLSRRCWYPWNLIQNKDYTHSARLIDIKELKKD